MDSTLKLIVEDPHTRKTHVLKYIVPDTTPAITIANFNQIAEENALYVNATDAADVIAMLVMEVKIWYIVDAKNKKRATSLTNETLKHPQNDWINNSYVNNTEIYRAIIARQQSAIEALTELLKL